MVQVTDLDHRTSCGPCGTLASRQESIPEYKKLMIKFVKILDDVQADDQLRLRLMILANCRRCCPRLVVPMTAVFMVAEHRQPLLIEMKGGAGPGGSRASTERRECEIMRTDSIKIFPCFAAHPPKPEKMESKDLYYQTHGSLESEIIIDGAGNLIDGYTSYLLAIRYGVSHVPVRYGRRQIITAAHKPGGLLYAWELPGLLVGKVHPGDKVTVQTARGYRRVTVEAVEEYAGQEPEPLKMVVRKGRMRRR